MLRLYSRCFIRGLPHSYRHLSGISNDIDCSVVDRLSNLGVDTKFHDEIVSTLASVYGKDISLSTLDAVGDSGIQELVESVQKQRPKAVTPVLRQRKEITISIPHHPTEFTLQWRQGQSLMQLAQDDEVLSGYIEASCSGTMACCSCHVYLDPDSFEALEGIPTTQERDILDLAYEWKETSRLGCQVYLTDELMKLDKVVVTIPSGVNNEWY